MSEAVYMNHIVLLICWHQSSNRLHALNILVLASAVLSEMGLLFWLNKSLQGSTSQKTYKVIAADMCNDIQINF